MLIIFSGVPGTGKSTIARRLAERLGAVWLRLDSLEPPIMAAFGDDIEDVGYRAAHGVAEDNLRLGHTVIADCVNDVEITRRGWHGVAERAGTPSLTVEVLCTNPAEHAARIEARRTDIPGLKLPSWPEVSRQRAEPWSAPRLTIDTAGRDIEDCVSEVLGALPDGVGR